MKRPLLFVIRIVALSALLAALVAARPQEKDILPSGDTTLSATISKKDILVHIHTVKLKKSDAGFPGALEQYEEVSMVPRMSISVNGQEIWIPRSAYADVFNPRKAFLKYEGGIFVLLIGGADGADSYSVHIRFDSDRVISRTVYNTVNPPRVSEKTIYSKTEMIG